MLPPLSDSLMRSFGSATTRSSPRWQTPRQTRSLQTSGSRTASSGCCELPGQTPERLTPHRPSVLTERTQRHLPRPQAGPRTRRRRLARFKPRSTLRRLPRQPAPGPGPRASKQFSGLTQPCLCLPGASLWPHGRGGRAAWPPATARPHVAYQGPPLPSLAGYAHSASSAVAVGHPTRLAISSLREEAWKPRFRARGWERLKPPVTACRCRMLGSRPQAQGTSSLT